MRIFRTSSNISVVTQEKLQAESVINCRPEKADILRALNLAGSPEFRKTAAKAVNPYGDGNSSGRIHEIIKRTMLSGPIDLRKRFYDLDF